MVDIYPYPQTEQVEELRGYLGDAFLFSVIKKIIRSMNQGKIQMDCVATWKALTRQMFCNYPAMDVFDWVCRCLEEANDKDWFEKKYPKGFWSENWVYPKKKSVIKINLQRSRTKKLINDNIQIIDIAKLYGLKVKNKMALCPFHADKNMSLSLSNEKNVFHCFGCGSKGDIIEFVRKLEQNNIIKKRSENVLCC